VQAGRFFLDAAGVGQDQGSAAQQVDQRAVCLPRIPRIVRMAQNNRRPQHSVTAPG
jgi:hypothetical protein